MTVYYCCDAFEQANGIAIYHFYKKDSNEFQTIKEDGWYLWCDDHGIQCFPAIQHCPWCGVRLDRYTRFNTEKAEQSKGCRR